MDVFHGFEDLINDVLLVDFFEDVCSDDDMQISLHEVKHHVEIFVVFCFDDVDQADNVLMAIEFLEEHNLTKSSLCISGIVERIKDFLQCDDLLGFLAECLPNDTVCAFTKLLDYLELAQDVWLDFFV